MSTIEKLFVQIFDRKRQIVQQLNHQKQLYDQSLASKLLIQGITPPPWLLNFAESSKELNKEELISGLLLPCPQPLPSHCNATYLYGKLPHDLYNATSAGAKGLDDYRPEVLPQALFSSLEDLHNHVAESPQERVASDISAYKDQSLARIQRSKSRQKDFELRSSRKLSLKRKLEDSPPTERKSLDACKEGSATTSGRDLSSPKDVSSLRRLDVSIRGEGVFQGTANETDAPTNLLSLNSNCRDLDISTFKTECDNTHDTGNAERLAATELPENTISQAEFLDRHRKSASLGVPLSRFHGSHNSDRKMNECHSAPVGALEQTNLRDTSALTGLTGQLSKGDFNCTEIETDAPTNFLSPYSDCRDLSMEGSPVTANSPPSKKEMPVLLKESVIGIDEFCERNSAISDLFKDELMESQGLSREEDISMSESKSGNSQNTRNGERLLATELPENTFDPTESPEQLHRSTSLGVPLSHFHGSYNSDMKGYFRCTVNETDVPTNLMSPHSNCRDLSVEESPVTANSPPSKKEMPVLLKESVIGIDEFCERNPANSDLFKDELMESQGLSREEDISMSESKKGNSQNTRNGERLLATELPENTFDPTESPEQLHRSTSLGVPLSHFHGSYNSDMKGDFRCTVNETDVPTNLMSPHSNCRDLTVVESLVAADSVSSKGEVSAPIGVLELTNLSNTSALSNLTGALLEGDLRCTTIEIDAPTNLLSPHNDCRNSFGEESPVAADSDSRKGEVSRHLLIKSVVGDEFCDRKCESSNLLTEELMENQGLPKEQDISVCCTKELDSSSDLLSLEETIAQPELEQRNSPFSESINPATNSFRRRANSNLLTEELMANQGLSKEEDISLCHIKELDASSDLLSPKEHNEAVGEEGNTPDLECFTFDKKLEDAENIGDTDNVTDILTDMDCEEGNTPDMDCEVNDNVTDILNSSPTVLSPQNSLPEVEDFDCLGDSPLEHRDTVGRKSSVQELMNFTFYSKSGDTHDTMDSEKLVAIDLPKNSIDRAGFLERLCRSASLDFPFSHPHDSHSSDRKEDVCHSVPVGVLEQTDLRNTSAENDDIGQLLKSSHSYTKDAVGKSYSDYSPTHRTPFAWDFQGPYMSPFGNATEGMTAKSRSSSKCYSFNPELTCFPIEESGEEDFNADDDDHYCSEETYSVRKSSCSVLEEHRNVVDIDPVFKMVRLTSVSTETSISSSNEQRSPSPEITCMQVEENMEEHVNVVAAQVCQETNGSARQPLRDISKRGTESLTMASKMSEIYTKISQSSEAQLHRSGRLRKRKVTQNSSLGTSGKKHFESRPTRFSKPKVSVKSGLETRGGSFSLKEEKPSNIVSSINSFVPLVQKKQAASCAPVKKEVRVKALEAADAARRLEEKKEKERNQKKEAMKLERAKVEKEKLKRLELLKKAKEEEKKRKEVEIAERKRKREEEDEARKEKEKKKKRVGEAQKQKKVHEDKMPVDTLECTSQAEDGKTDKQREDNQTASTVLTFASGDQKINGLGISSDSCQEQKNFSATEDGCSTPTPNESTQTIREKSYDISPYCCSDDEEEPDESSNKKFKPAWASKSSIKMALASLDTLDCDAVFPPSSFCSLTEVLIPRQLKHRFNVA